MFLKSVLITAFAVAACAALTTPALADSLAAPPLGASRSNPVSAMPQRGQSMAQVERGFGAPQAKLPDAGGGTPRQPVIHRWRYDGLTVYFERTRVIHSVVDASVAATHP